MAITNGYLTLAQFKERMWPPGNPALAPDADRDAEIEDMITAASRWIDNYCGRHFYAAIETRYFTAEWGDLLFVDDLISVTTLQADDDADRTYETIWAATDYDLEPYNAAYDNPPQAYNMIRVRTDGDYSFPAGVRRGVEIAGSWGWPMTSITSTATLGEDLDTSETGVDVSDGAAFAVGMTIQIDSEIMIVDSISTNTLTVRRAQNGTTAATHSDTTAITVLTPADPIHEACWLLAARLFKRKDAILGVAGASQFGQTTIKVPEDKDVIALISDYIRSVP